MADDSRQCLNNNAVFWKKKRRRKKINENFKTSQTAIYVYEPLSGEELLTGVQLGVCCSKYTSSILLITKTMFFVRERS